MILLSVKELSKRYGPEPVLDRISFDVRAGERRNLTERFLEGSARLGGVAVLEKPHAVAVVARGPAELLGGYRRQDRRRGQQRHQASDP